jgi:Zn-dependent M28 family amino/carboxypeptidase
LKTLSFIVLLIFSTPVFAQKTGDMETLKKVVYILTGDSMQGREAGSAGEVKAKNYIIACYRKIGLTPLLNTYIQKFTFPKDSTQTDTAMNIIGMIDNKAYSTIIIGAHYDHLGMGGSKSRSLTSHKIHPGADDNASGVAMMLALAEHLKKLGSKKFNYLFIAFSAEEEGLYGSQAFVKYNRARIKLMLNLVMVGRLDTRNPVLKVMRDERKNHLDSLLHISTSNSFSVNLTSENINYTDAWAFIQQGVTAVSFTTGMHDDYHKTTDTADKINYEGMWAITNYIECLIEAVCR